MTQYGEFAHFYDAMMHDVDYGRWVRYLDSLLKEFGVRTVLDCACGTGRITIGLGKLGYSVIGSDLSEDMLMVARASALRAGLRTIPFVCQDLRGLQVHRAVDAVNCSCDGVNYLTSTDQVAEFLSSAYRCLKPNGILLFDVSSEHKLADVIKDNTFTEDTEDYAYIWNNNYDPNEGLVEMQLTFFVREGEHFQRFSECHLQRAHKESELSELLTQCGFTLLGAYDAFTKDKPCDSTERIQFVARRNG